MGNKTDIQLLHNSYTHPLHFVATATLDTRWHIWFSVENTLLSFSQVEHTQQKQLSEYHDN